MHRSGEPDEVRPGPRMPDEELVRQHVALQPVAGGTGGYDVARGVGASVREGIDVIEGRDGELEPLSAVHAAPTTVTHGGALEGTLGVEVEKAPAAAEAAG